MRWGKRTEPQGKAVGARLPEPGRDRGRVRQGCAGAGCGTRHGVRVRGNWDGHATGAKRQPQAAFIPADGGSRGHQPPRIQQRGACRRARAARQAAAARDRRRQHRREQGGGRPGGRLRAGVEGVRGGGKLFHGQHLVAEHTRVARPASASAARRAVVASDGGSGRDRSRRQTAPADRGQDRARHRGRGCGIRFARG